MSFREDLKKRILVLDGAMGTMLQKGFTEEEVMLQYIEAGADIIITNTFNANKLVQRTLGRGDEAYDMAYEAACRARRIADAAGRKIYVAGGCGPTGISLTLASDASDPTLRDCTFDEFADAYKLQFEALIKGGVDLILLETCFDALNTKAAIYALHLLGNPLPLIVSATVSDRSDRTLTGQTLEAFYRSVSHAPTLAAFGINCSLGPAEMAPMVREIASFSRHPLIFYPNAGLPVGDRYDGGTPEIFREVVGGLAKEGCINIAGGCCGTTPEHIKSVCEAVRGCSPRVCPDIDSALYVSGLESFEISPLRNFTNIGERTNVAGSKKFARLIAESNYPEALAIARAQILGGADIIDINMDDPMVDSTEKMRSFLRAIAAEPDIARAAIMIDSSHWETVVEGLKNTAGRSIVNSISLKDGEADFVRKALEIRALGAAMVVMAFDEEGQAVTLERKISICARSYRLLTGAGIPASDIIFDCNILSIGTGLQEHARYGIDFIEAVRWIKANLPGARTSGGVSNLSFAFRGNNAVREAMHSVFLYHAIKAGLDMAIVNPQMLQVYDEIDPALRRAVEDVIFDADPDATSRLIALAPSYSGEARADSPVAAPQRPADVRERLIQSLVKGDSAFLREDVLECLESLGKAVDVIEGPLMSGMAKVGDLFAEGRMFLPQVVKSARVMHDAVEVLQPYMNEGDESSGKPKFVIATVQGDVHDIGKNITSIVLQCSGFDVIDMGVMVPCADIIDKAVETGASCIGVSGLITPSLHRMEELCKDMDERGLRIPVFVGGAATSALHTAVKLAPLYSNVYHCQDASATAVKANRYLSEPDSFISAETAEQERVRTLKSVKPCGCKCCEVHEGGFLEGHPLNDIPFKTLESAELTSHFDWKFFKAVCRMNEDAPDVTAEVERYLNAGVLEAKVSVRFFDCHREGDDIVCDKFRLPMLRDGESLSDFLPENGTSQLGLFAVSVAEKTEFTDGNDIIRHAVKVTLAESASQWISASVTNMLNMVTNLLSPKMALIMPGIGYSCCPDHSLKRDILALLPKELGITLTDSCAMVPEASICGLVIAHRDAHYPPVRTIGGDALKSYAKKRSFSPADVDLFLSHLVTYSE